MRRYLVVAHQTLDSPDLMEVLRRLLAEEATAFHLVVPEFHGPGLVWSEGRVKVEAEHRLEAARLAFTAAGLAVDGEVGQASPVDAVAEVLRRDGDDAYAGIVVSTLPLGISRWVGMDVPARIRKATSLPVVHVVSEPVTV